MRAWLIVLALMFGAAPVAAQPGSITKLEARTEPPTRVKRLVMDQLNAILKPDDARYRKPPTRPLTDMRLRTDPRPTEVPGLCKLDQLTVEFEPRRKSDGDDEETPVSASGFKATRYYHFTAPPLGAYNQLADFEKPQTNPACAKARLWEDEFFTAESEEMATDGYLLAYRVMDAIIAGKPSFALACDKPAFEEKLECAEMVRNFRTQGISSIDRCEANLPGAPAAYCYQLYIGDRTLRIVTDGYTSTKVLRAEVGFTVLLVHERID